ncbi:MAG: FlgD immunoglobulin-like domain containing protein [Bacteroidota bacterium]
MQNYPNPFSARGGSAYGGNPTTTIHYLLPNASHVTVSIYDMLGRWVTTIVDGDMPAGDHSAIWDGRDASGDELSSGVYLCRIIAPSSCETIKIMLLR